MSVSLATATVDAQNNATTALLNSGTIKIYTGTRPANANTALSSNTLLATLTFGATAFAASSSGVSTANAVTAGTAGNTGTATFARLFKSDGTTVVCDCDVTATGGGGDLTLPTTSIVSGETVSVASLTYKSQ